MTKTYKTAEQMKDFSLSVLDQHKALDVRVLHIEKISDIASWIIIATGSSSRHVKSLADKIVSNSKERGLTILGVEGTDSAKWALVDLGEVVVNIMQQETRDFYQLEKLWSQEHTEALAANG